MRGPVDAAAHTGAFELYRARVALPDAAACGVTVPHGPGLGPPSYACDFDGGVDVARAMGRLARRAARCAHVGIGNPPRFSAGPAFMFDNGAARFDFSAAKVEGKPGLWTVTLAVTRGPKAPRGPRT